MNLKILQNTGIIEYVNSELIKTLYDLVSDDLLEEESNLVGTLSVGGTYLKYINTLINKFNNLHINSDKIYIWFTDPNVKLIMMVASSDNIGVTSSDASKFTLNLFDSLASSFRNNTNITSFNELKEFTSVTSLDLNFFNCSNLTSIDLTNITSLGFSTFVNTNLTGVINLPNFLRFTQRSNFLDCAGITEVNFGPNTIISNINDNSLFYGCTNLVRVTGLRSPSGLGGDYFRNCSNLEYIDLDFSNLVKILSGTFCNCSKLFTDLDLSLTNITDIELDSFLGCTSLLSVILPPTITTIGNSTFKGCTNLTTVTGLSNITELKNEVFRSCSNLETIDIDFSKITKIGNNVFLDCTSLVLSNVDLSNVTSIGQNAFANSKLTSITGINPNITGNSMFTNCSSLTSVSGSGIISIPGNAFKDCSNLTSFEMSFQNTTTIEESAFYNCSKLEFNSPIDLSNITAIWDKAFYNCTKLIVGNFPRATTYYSQCFSGIGNVSIVIPKEVLRLSNYCFGACKSLKTVSFEVDSDPQLVSSLTTMQNVFRDCDLLEGSINIPEGFTTSEGGNFYNCAHLTSVTYPSTTTSIGNAEFMYSGVKSFTIKATTPPTIQNGTFAHVDNNFVIYVPAGSVSTYLSALYWSSVASKILADPNS